MVTDCFSLGIKIVHSALNLPLLFSLCSNIDQHLHLIYSLAMLVAKLENEENSGSLPNTVHPSTTSSLLYMHSTHLKIWQTHSSPHVIPTVHAICIPKNAKKFECRHPKCFFNHHVAEIKTKTEGYVTMKTLMRPNCIGIMKKIRILLREFMINLWQPTFATP